MKQWNINLFSPAVREKIVQETGKRIPLPEHPQEIPDIQQWAGPAVRTSRVEKAIFCFFAVFMLILGFCSMCSQLAWNDRVKNWDKADGIILKNTTKRVKSRKYTKTVADVEYQYTYKGKQYFGTKIVYDSESFPDLKPGVHRQVIVNPENPQDCAIMFWYRGYWGWMRYLNCAVIYLFSVFLFAIFFRSLVPKKIVVPEALKTYIATFSAEQFYAALNKERPGAMLSRVEMRFPMEYRQEGRYGIIRQRDSKVNYILFGALLILAITLSFVIPLCWIVVAILGFVIYSMYFSRITVFDFQEKKIYGCRFRPENSGQMKAVQFTEIDHFSLSALLSGRQEKFIGLFAVKHNGTNVPLCKVNTKRLALLLELLPELAEKTGHLPITYI